MPTTAHNPSAPPPPSPAVAPHPPVVHLTQFEEPALSVGVEEGVREVVAVVLGDLEGLILDALVQVLGTNDNRGILMEVNRVSAKHKCRDLSHYYHYHCQLGIGQI